MTLHCCYAPHGSATAKRLLAVVVPGDGVLFLGQAVLATSDKLDFLSPWVECNLALYALAEDVAAYGLRSTHEAVDVIDYEKWVDLMARYEQQQIWR